MSAPLSTSAGILGRLGEQGAGADVGFAVAGVLLVLLVVREMARASLAGERVRRVEGLRFAIIPLCAIVAAIILRRGIELMT